MAPFVLFLFSHILLITIDKIIFNFFLNFPFTLSLFPPFILFLLEFYSSSIVSCISNPAIFFLFYKFLHQFLQILPNFSLFQSRFPHSLAWLQITLSSVALSTPFFHFSSFFISFLLPHFSLPLHIPITPLWWFPQYSLTFPSFSLVAAFHSSSFFFHFWSSDRLSYSSVFFFFTFFLISVVQFQPSFPHALPLLDISLSSPWSPCSSYKLLNFCLFFFSFLLFFLFSSFSFLSLLFLLTPLLLFFISQCDDFLNFLCNFLGAVLPAPALYPSLSAIHSYN